MPSVTDIIDAVATPPLASLQQVLDTGGPYGPGSHTLQNFTTNGAFLLPAGSYSVSGTYGVIAQVSGVIPRATGFYLGYNDPAAVILPSGDRYADLIGQVNLIHFLPITGAAVITEYHDLHHVSELFLWPALLGSAAKLGLYVAPNWGIDLYYMCVL